MVSTEQRSDIMYDKNSNFVKFYLITDFNVRIPESQESHLGTCLYCTYVPRRLKLFDI